MTPIYIVHNATRHEVPLEAISRVSRMVLDEVNDTISISIGSPGAFEVIKRYILAHKSSPENEPPEKPLPIGEDICSIFKDDLDAVSHVLDLDLQVLFDAVIVATHMMMPKLCDKLYAVIAYRYADE